jgi:hypothetical protein
VLSLAFAWWEKIEASEMWGFETASSLPPKEKRTEKGRTAKVVLRD